jgi:hypothetical protein
MAKEMCFSQKLDFLFEVHEERLFIFEVSLCDCFNFDTSKNKLASEIQL